MNYLKRPLAGLCLASLVALAGCGGSSGGSKSNDGPITEVPGGGDNTGGGSDVTLSGVATKGVLKGARVTAYELNSAGARLADAVGSATTDNAGAYELELNDDYQGGLLDIEVSVVEGTRMVCDAAACGSVAKGGEVVLPAGFTLSAIVEKSANSNTINASVTAWSTMAANRAKAIIAADATQDIAGASKQAVSEVSQVVGFDIAKTTSRGLSQIDGANSAEAQYAVMNAAVAEILFQNSGSDLNTLFAGFASSLNDGVVGGADDVVKLAELSSAVRRVVDSVANLDASASEALNNQTAQYDAAGSAGFAPEYDEELVVDEGATQEQKIAAFQAFVAQTRTWVSSIGEADSEQLDLAIDADAEAVQAILDADTQNQFQFVGLVLDQTNAFLISNAANVQQYITSGAEKSISIKDDAGAEVGTATLVFADEDGLQVSVVGAVTGKASTTYLPFSLVVDTNLPIDALAVTAEEDYEGTYLDVRIAKLLASNTVTLSGYVEDGKGGKTLTLNQVSVSLELDKALEGEGVATDDINTNFKSASLVGDVRIAHEGVTFAGNVEAELVKLVSGSLINSSPISLKSFRVIGEFSMADGSHSFSASASLDVKNAASFDTFAWSEYSNARMSFYGTPSVTLVDQLLGHNSQEASTLWLQAYAYADGDNWFDYNFQPRDVPYDGERPYAWDTRRLEPTERAAIEVAVRQMIAADLDGNTQLAGEMKITGFSLRASAWPETSHDGSGIVLGDTHYSSSLYADARFPDLETAENFMKVAFTLSAQVKIPELETAQVTATINRSSYRGGSLRTNVKWNNGNYTILLSSDDIEAATAANVSIFNSQGYELNLDLTFKSGEEGGSIADLTGKALLNGEQVGTVEYRGGMPVIVYPNGDEEIFESLY